VVDRIEHRTAGVGNPQGGEAEVVQLGSGFGGLVGIAVAQLGAPYATPTPDRSIWSSSPLTDSLTLPSARGAGLHV